MDPGIYFLSDEDSYWVAIRGHCALVPPRRVIGWLQAASAQCIEQQNKYSKGPADDRYVPFRPEWNNGKHHQPSTTIVPRLFRLTIQYSSAISFPIKVQIAIIYIVLKVIFELFKKRKFLPDKMNDETVQMISEE
ncbi:hypothetical protein Clacol_004341 [Clathrus columnatus]|uniref:Uncharacterized protein n=1 Tax=Clathrus columnatus TaxID=1419009 RepID=A0AAV5AB23_9AGAM|nr:hypothetical protein Clacol_004341 [Clathrus columnatus]